MAWKWWKPKDDPLKNKYVHEIEVSKNAIDDETNNRETAFKDLDETTKRSVLLSFLNVGETLKNIEDEDEVNSEDLPKDQTRKWRLFRNRIAHDPLWVQGKSEYVQEHIDDLNEIDEQIEAYWLEKVRRRKKQVDQEGD
ncbi:MAG: hypothetical protein AAF587_08815 [Bacteroidota bacterium]